MTKPNGTGGYAFEDLSVGMSSAFAKTVTDDDIVLFAGVSGDTNPVHLDEDYARQSPFGGRIAHGLLTASFISTVLGTQLPGPGCIYLGQDLRFTGPVHIGDTVEARVEVTELVPGKRRVVLRTTCLVGNKIVIEGHATVLVPSRA
ncbi:MAG: MaoC family dehydratase [Proteobacteria bacterium]|nr:MaoC family dehydratase [Pseudomonadota bacterium]